MVVRIVVEENPVVAALIDSTRLTEAEALHRSKVEAALGKLINEWALRWKRHA